MTRARKSISGPFRPEPVRPEVRQYGELAKYYDLLYSWKDYAKEAEVLRQLIRRYKRSRGNKLLDVGCGTGKHIQQLKKGFDCVGVDVNQGMLKEARRNVRGVEFVKGDMVDFCLGREFDVVLCLFSSIGYLRTTADLAKALRNFAAHLRTGGVAIIEPWFTKSTAIDGHVHVLTQGTADLKVVRVDYTKVEGDHTVLDERIVVAEKGKGITGYRDRMVMSLFEREEFLESMKRAGLEARYLGRSLAPGRGLYVGVKA